MHLLGLPFFAIAAVPPLPVGACASLLAENSSVPEPSVALALILGSVAMLWILRRRN
jgi:hypothetical protein